MASQQNPFFEEFNTLHGTPPFSKINNSHWLEAIERGMALEDKEIDEIASQESVPTFENTTVPLAYSGKDLSRVTDIFFPFQSACCDDELMEIADAVIPKLNAHSLNIVLNEKLWERIKYVYDHIDEYENLDNEDKMLIKVQYRYFEKAGASFKGEDRETLKKYNVELGDLINKFSQNIIKELKTYELYLSKDDLDGLTPHLINQAADDAMAKGREGEYLFTLAQPTYFAFMRSSSRADLREKMYRLYRSRNQKGEFDNTKIMLRIAELYQLCAKMHGFKNYAESSLETTMAKNPKNVYDLLYKLRDAYSPVQDKEFEELTQFASEFEGKPVKINSWDYSYYYTKLREAKYSYDIEKMRPYFELGNTIKGVFGLATKLYGITFVENPEIEVYHPDVKAYDVKDEDGSFLGVLYADFFPRETKQPGAWMTSFASQYIDRDGVNHRPIVSIVMNFTKPQGNEPSLLTVGEVNTFLHEFGHALHGLFANTKYSTLSGTSVYRDFVELPSQFNENYVHEKEFLDGFAKHYKTGEPIPQEYIDRMINASRFGAGTDCMRQLIFGLLDMAYATHGDGQVEDPVALEKDLVESLDRCGWVEGTLIAPTFSHIFAGGYTAGYYSYKWAEVLEADAFSVFKKNGIFDKKTAKSFRDNILSKGHTEEPDVLYRRFRGQDPTIDALLERDGIKVK